MTPKEIRKILNNEDTFDIAKSAEAVLEDARNREKRSKPRSREKSFVAYRRIKDREYKEEKFRQKLAELWNKTHK